MFAGKVLHVQMRWSSPISRMQTRLFSVAPPKVAKASTVTCRCRCCYWIVCIGDICVSETVSNSDTWLYLPWAPWAPLQEIEMILIAKVSKESDIALILRRDIAGAFAYKPHQRKHGLNFAYGNTALQILHSKSEFSVKFELWHFAAVDKIVKEGRKYSIKTTKVYAKFERQWCTRGQCYKTVYVRKLRMFVIS